MEASPDQTDLEREDGAPQSWRGRRLIVGGAVAALAAAVLIGLAGSLPGSGSSGTWTMPGIGGPAAKAAAVSAIEVAEAWAEDAQLAAASCVWADVGTSAAVDAEWTFQFYSPSAQRLALIGVFGDQARLVRDALSLYPIPMFQTSEWIVDSDEALHVWWDHAGRSLVQRHPGTDVAVQLRISDEHEMQLVWSVVGLVGDHDDAVIAVISAVDGALVD